MRLFGLENEPIAPAEVGWHYKKGTFDNKNRQLSESYYDVRDQPVNRPRTIHQVVFTNDELGRRIATTFFGTDGSPGSRLDRVHKITQEYDRTGRVVKESYFDASNKPLVIPDGFQSVAYRRDAQGNIIERSFFDAEGKATTWMPDPRVYLRYDGSGNAVEEAYFDTDGRPVMGTGGVHRIARKFDGHGKITEISFFDTKGEPASVFGRHRTAFIYDRGEFVSESYFDAKGQPAIRNGILGKRKKLDDVEMLDQDGNPTSTVSVITVSSLPFPGGPGDTAGVRVGDIILIYDNWRFPIDRDVVDWNQATNGLRAATSAPGETPRRLVVLRDGLLVEQMVAPGPLQVRLTSEPSSTAWIRAAAKDLN